MRQPYYLKRIFNIVAISFLVGCSAISSKPGASSVMILTETPDAKDCRFLGEVAGSQGNWLTGGFTSDKDLLIGARNDLKNATYKLGGNTVHIQHTSDSGRYEASGNTNSTVIGNAYDCR